MEIGVHGAAAAFRRHAETRQQVEARMVEDRQRIVHRAGRLGVDAQQLIDALRSIGGGKAGDVDLRRLDDQSLEPARCYVEMQRRSEEHTSELQSLMRISYAVFCLKKKNQYTHSNDRRLNSADKN